LAQMEATRGTQIVDGSGKNKKMMQVKTLE
jgi:hypothetical protein